MKPLKSKLDAEKLAPLLEKLLQFARIAETIARRSLGILRGFAIAGILSALGLTISALIGWHLSLAQGLILLLILLLPILGLGKLYLTLHDTLDLPVRVSEASAKIKKKSVGAWQTAGEFKAKAAAQELKKPKFSDLLNLGRSALELKDYGDEALDIVAAISETLILVNPLFLLILAVSGLAVLGEIVFGLGLGWLYLKQ